MFHNLLHNVIMVYFVSELKMDELKVCLVSKYTLPL